MIEEKDPKMSDEKVSELTGEQSLKQAPKFIVPAYRLNGKEGCFKKYNPETKEEEDVETGTLKVVMIKHRRIFTAFTDKVSTFTNEHNSFRDKINVFQNKKQEDGSQKREFLETGYSTDLKDKYGLKMTQNIYCMDEEGNIIKLMVSGKGLSYLFEYLKSFEGEKEHVWQYVTLVSIKKEEGKLGEYYALTFSQEQQVEDKDAVIEKIVEVNNAFQAIDSYHQENEKLQKESQEREQNQKEESGNVPIINEDEDDVDVDRIPF